MNHSSRITGHAGLVLAVLAVFAPGLGPRAADARTIQFVEGDSIVAEVTRALSEGDTLLVPPGRYRLTETLAGGVTVRGVGPVDSVVMLPYIPSIPILNFHGGSDTTRVENITFDCTGFEEGSGLHFRACRIGVRGNRFTQGVGVQADSCDGTISENHFEDVESALQCRDSRLWVDRNEIIGAKNGAISMRGSPLRITRNKIIRNVNTGLVIVGKRFVPVIGGESGMGNEIYGGFNSDVINNSGKDVNAQYNYWGIKSTEEMNRFGYPANIDAIIDNWDFEKEVGQVDYRNWLDAPPPDGRPVRAGSGATSQPSRRILLAVGGAIVLIVLVVKVLTSRSSGAAAKS